MGRPYLRPFTSGILTMTETAMSPSSLTSAELKALRARPHIRLWLFVVVATIFLMVVVGGATRLTDSGLSITEWKPVTGIIPPLTQSHWEEEFSKYRDTPEYRRVNRNMTLDEFKVIYWWEWGHRFLGRMIGFVFAIPFLVFWLTGRIEKWLMPRLIVMFVLGGLQGALGWFMVMSGLVDRVDVSQYRLTAHLGFALIILGYIFWVALSLEKAGRPAYRWTGQAVGAAVVTALVFVQILLGGLVAGLKAGFTYNTWPLMDGAFFPEGLYVHDPWYLAPFEDILTAQFNHRMFAYALLAAVIFYGLFWVQGELRRSAHWLILVTLLQVGLGIWTLLAVVPISLGLAHQAMAVVVLMVALHHLYRSLTAQVPRLQAQG